MHSYFPSLEKGHKWLKLQACCLLKTQINTMIYRMAGAFYIVKNSGDITNNTLTSLSAVCCFHVTATGHC